MRPLPAALASAAACAVAPFFTYHAAPTAGDAFHMTMLQLGAGAPPGGRAQPRGLPRERDALT